jgi:excisionase family DNA binding protein
MSSRHRFVLLKDAQGAVIEGEDTIMSAKVRDVGSERLRLATVGEVAEYLGLPQQTLYTYRLDGRGPSAIKIGRHLRYRWSDVDAWVESQGDSGRA